MAKPKKPTKEHSKKSILVSIGVGIVLGLCVTAGVLFYLDEGHSSSGSDYAKALKSANTSNATAKIPMSKELTKQRLSLSKKIQSMDCAVVDPHAKEENLTFNCKKPTAKRYTRKELLDL